MALWQYPELQPGREILAKSLSAGAPAFVIKVCSSQLARGGRAVILKGEVISPCPSVVALKVIIDADREDSDHYQEMIRREIMAVQRIQHRFILPFLGVFMGARFTVLVSGFMDNGNLLEYLRTKRDANRRLLIIQVADAVNYLHTQAGLVHGDLKCQNVLVSPHGDAQLADFGLSTSVDKPLSADTTTVGIRQTFTLQFAAPELLSDEVKSSAGKTRSKTAQTDVFAFGRLVLQAFSGNVPWPDLPFHVVFNKVLKNGIPARRDEATAHGLDDEWWAVCVKCWRTTPQERPTMGRILLELSETGSRHTGQAKTFAPSVRGRSNGVIDRTPVAVCLEWPSADSGAQVTTLATILLTANAAFLSPGKANATLRFITSISMTLSLASMCAGILLPRVHMGAYGDGLDGQNYLERNRHYTYLLLATLYYALQRLLFIGSALTFAAASGFFIFGRIAFGNTSSIFGALLGILCFALLTIGTLYYAFLQKQRLA